MAKYEAFQVRGRGPPELHDPRGTAETLECDQGWRFQALGLWGLADWVPVWRAGQDEGSGFRWRKRDRADPGKQGRKAPSGPADDGRPSLL